MSLTKQELQQLNNTNFPNNTTGYITPELLREFNSAEIDALALQSDLDTFSASVSTQLDNLNEFSSSLVTNFATVAQLNQSSSQIEAQIDTLATTASVTAVSNSLYVFKGDQSVVNQNVSDTFTANNLKFNQYTQSTDLALSGKASLSQDNYFVGNQYVDGKVTVDGNISASGDIRAVGNVYGANLTGSFISSSTFNTFSSSVSTQFSASTFFSGTQYKGDSSSFDSRISNIVAATGFVSTASFNAYTASTNSDISALETFTASVSTSVGLLQTFSSSQYKLDSASFSVRIEGIDDDNVTTASFNAYTSSTDSKINSIQSFTASVSTSVGALQTFSGSEYKTDSASFDSRIDNISAPIGYVTTSSFNAYTQSNDTKVNNLTAATASYAISSSVKVVTDNLQTQINTLSTTASVNTLSASIYQTDATQSNAITNNSASAATALNNFSASNYQTDVTQSNNLTSLSSSVTTTINNLSSSIFQTDATQSNNISALSASNAFNHSRFATTGSNTFNGNQIVNGDITASNISVGTLTATTIHTIIESSSVIYSSGSNQFGDASDDVQTLYGSVRVVNELTASGLHYPTADNGVKSFMQTDGNGNLSLQYVNTVYETVRNTNAFPIVKGAPLFASGSTGDNANVFYADASDANVMPAVYIAGETLAPGATGLAIVGGLIEGVDTTGLPAGTIVYVAEGGGWSANRPVGANSIVQVLGVVQKEGVGGQGVVINQLEAVLPNIQTGYVWVGNGTNQPVAVATSSLVTTIDTGSLVTTASFNAFTQSISSSVDTISSSVGVLQTEVNSLTSQTASYAISSSVKSVTDGLQNQINTLATTSSLNDLSASIYSTDSTQSSLINGKLDTSSFNTFSTSVDSRLDSLETFSGSEYKTDSASFSSRINSITGSGGTIDTSSFATTGSNTFTGQQNIQNFLYIEEPGNPLIYTQFLQDPLTNKLQVNQVGASGIQLNNIDVNMGQLTASLQEGYVWVGDSAGRTTTVATSSFGGGGTIDTGSFATTGSNTFVGDQTISGSESIINFTDGGIQTLKLVPYISSSAFNGNRNTALVARAATSTDGVTFTQSPTSPVNIIFEQALLGGASVSANSIISGSNNIVTGLRTAATNAAEIRSNYSYISVFPSTRTPAYAPVQFNNSNVNGLITVTNNSVGLSSSLALGSAAFGYGNAATIVNSSILTNTILNPNSSSVNLNTVLNAGVLTVNGNKVNPDFTTATGSGFNNNYTINAGTTTLFDRASGSFNFGSTGFSRNIYGGIVTVTNPISATTNANLQNSIVVGSNLIVTGSDGSNLNNGGSAFFGRYNISDGVVNNTSNVVFAVGAGTAGNTRTPLWVGTDTTVNVTGSLRVSGTNLSIDSDGAITASKILVTDSGTTAIQYNQQSTGSVAGVYATSYGKDNIKVYQYQGQPYAFNVNLTANQANAYTGSQFEWALQLNGSNVSLPGGGGTYFAMVSGSNTGSNGDPGADKKGLNYLGTSMILDMYADTSFRRKVYVEGGMFVSGAAGGSTPALIIDGTSVGNRAIQATGSVDITGSLTVNGTTVGAVGYGSYYTTTTNSGSVLTFLTEESAVGFENVSGSYMRTTQSGMFLVTANVDIDNAASVGSSEISLKKNGSTITGTTFTAWFANTSTKGGATSTAIVSMNTNDYIEVGLALGTSDTVTTGRVSITKIA